MNILRIYCSPRGSKSESARLADAIVGFLLERHPSAEIVDRYLAEGAISHVDEDYADVVGGYRLPPESLEAGTMAESERLIRELEAADYVVIGTPMHNYTVPSALKAWIDHIVRIHRTFQPSPDGKVGVLKDRPVYVAVSSGSKYSHGRTRQPDFLTPYLTAILNTVGLRDLAFFSVEGTGPREQGLDAARKKAERQLADRFAPSALA